jgi:hypothetical protein
MPFGGSKTFGFSNEIIPFLVISGTGSGVGVFVYNGTPELGNPPIAWLTNGSLLDPYGNVLPAVMGIAGVGEFSAGNTIITPNGLFLYTTGGQLSFSLSTVNGHDPKNGNPYFAGLWAYNTAGGGGAALVPGTNPTLLMEPPDTATMSLPPQLESGAEQSGLVNELLLASLFSGQETGNPGNCAVQVFSGSNDQTIEAQGALIITGNAVLRWYATQIYIYNAINAVDGTAANPHIISTDVWHNVAASSGFTVATVQRYRLYPDNTVHIQFDLTSTNVAGNYTLFNLPAGYIPATRFDGSAPRVNNTAAAYSAALLNTGFRVSTAGAVQIISLPGTAVTEIAGHYVIPLD